MSAIIIIFVGKNKDYYATRRKDNIWDLGMIYKIDVKDDATVDLDMTFTAPSCPAADFILEDVRSKVDSVEGVKSANVNLVFEPAWDQSMMSEEARVELGFE